MESGSDNKKTFPSVWDLFTKKGNFIATCNACNKDFSYKSCVSNLKKHWTRIHVKKNIDDDDTDCSDEEWSENDNSENKTALKIKKSKSISKSEAWEYFEVPDSDQFIATCKICNKEIAYDSMSDLAEHVKEHDVVISDDEQETTTGKNKRSLVWQYMVNVDEKLKNATCIICKKQLSYAASAGNLNKHIKRVHPNIDLSQSNEDNVKKLIVSSNGQLYEIETSDTEKDPIDTVYLEEAINGDIVDNFKTTTPPRKTIKIEKLPLKNNKDVFQKTTKRNIISEDDSQIQKRPNNDTLDIFGNYMVSLLKELPRNVADQLQNDFIKQIFAAKYKVDNRRYSVSNTNSVPVTVNNSNIIAEIIVDKEVVLDNTDENINNV